MATILFSTSGCQWLSKIVFSEMHQEKDFIGDVTEFNQKVKTTQSILNGIGYDTGGIDGVMGKKTRLAIKQFQEKSKIMVTGYIGKKTWKALEKEKEKLDENIFKAGLSTKDIQRALTNAGYDSGPVDGVMGQKTKTAIKKFQKEYGLKSDGVVGEKTREKLYHFL